MLTQWFPRVSNIAQSNILPGYFYMTVIPLTSSVHTLLLLKYFLCWCQCDLVGLSSGNLKEILRVSVQQLTVNSRLRWRSATDSQQPMSLCISAWNTTDLDIKPSKKCFTHNGIYVKAQTMILPWTLVIAEIMFLYWNYNRFCCLKPVMSKDTVLPITYLYSCKQTMVLA